MKIYLATWTGNIYESGYSTISAHKTLKNAEIAIAFHREAVIEETMEYCGCDREDAIKALRNADWQVYPMELEE